jgi:prepilin-type processing-associated H-X9-DG protein
MTGPASTVLLFEVTGNEYSSAGGYKISTETPGGQSPAGNGVDLLVGNGSNNLGGAGALNNQTCATCLKYATGVLGNACINGATSPCDRNPNDITATTSYFAAGIGRHNGGSNYVMADGHCKFMLPTVVGAGVDTWTPNYTPPACPPTPNYQAPSVGCTSPIPWAATFSLQ